MLFLMKLFYARHQAKHKVPVGFQLKQTCNIELRIGMLYGAKGHYGNAGNKTKDAHDQQYISISFAYGIFN